MNKEVNVFSNNRNSENSYSSCAAYPVEELLLGAALLVALLDVPSANVCTGSHDAL
jgi:hypothetical protein